MSRLSLVLIWFFAVMAGAWPAAHPPAGWRAQANILQADPAAVPQPFKLSRAERLQSGAPARPAPARHTLPHTDLVRAGGTSLVLPAGHSERSPQRHALPVPAPGLGTPRFPTGPPPA